MKNIQYTKLKENMTKLFGEKGKKWLNDLDMIVERLANHWQLTAIKPVENMTFNYVVKAVFKNQPVVLKIICDQASYIDEMKALDYFNGNASIKLIDHHPNYYALLFQQAVPGTTLKSLYPKQAEFVIDAYIKTVQELHFQSVPVEHNFRQINDWLKAIDRTTSDIIPNELLKKAMSLKEKLLLSPSKQFVLHGDLHHDNSRRSRI